MRRIGEEAMVFAEYPEEEEGTAIWDATDLPENGYVLRHETLDAQGKVLDTLETRFHVLRDTLVHSGSVVDGETWSNDVVHIVAGAVTVSGEYTLAIEDNAIVKFLDGGKLWVLTGGVLNANGVIFTHIGDDSVGGDTNQDGNATLPLYDGYDIDIVNAEVIAETCELRYRTFTMPTTISGNLLLAGGRTYKTTENTTVANGATLTLGAGTVLKFANGIGMTVNSGGKLVANGTLEKPVIFTSLTDDEFGGDTNRDADGTEPRAGEWKNLLVNGQTDLQYTFFRYGSAGANALLQIAGNTALTNCRFEHSANDGFNVRSSVNVTADNCLFFDCYGSAVWLENGSATVRNCTVDSCGYGIFANVGKALVYNTIVTRTKGKGSAQGWCLGVGNKGTMEARFCNLWLTGVENAGFLNSPTKIVQEQITYLEPLYRNVEANDFTLRPGSPMIDAGAAEYAPELDYFGAERVNDLQMADTGRPNAEGVCPDLGFAEQTVGSEAEGDVDLLVNWMRGPSAVLVGDVVEVRWQTVNAGTATAYGPWTDVVSVVTAESALGSQQVELGEVVCSGTLMPNGFSEYSAHFTIPPMSEGIWRFQVALNQYREVREGRNIENNIAQSEWTFRVSAPMLKAGTAELELAAGEATSLRLANLTAAGGLVVIRSGGRLLAGASVGYIASDGRTLLSAQKLSEGVWALSIPANQTGTVYLQLENQGNETATVEVVYDNAPFTIYAGEVREVPNRGTVTLPLVGTRLNGSMSVWLQCGSRKVESTRLVNGGNGIYWVTFNLEGALAGEYAVWARLPETGESASAPALAVTTKGVGPKWWCSLTGASTARTSRQSTLTFTYGNSGDTELPAPYVRFYNGSGATLRFSPDEDWQEEREFLAISGSYPYSMLKPGESRSITIYFTIPMNIERADINYTYTLEDDSDYPWETNAANMRPDWVDDEAWGHILAALKANVGDTWNDYLDTLREDLDQLGALGYVGCRLDQLWQMEVNAALGADGGISTLASATDLARSGRGMGIDFSRSYSAQLFRRMRTGVLGRGWTFSYDYSCKMDSGQAEFDISYPGGSTRAFTKTGKYWYAKQADDRGRRPCFAGTR